MDKSKNMKFDMKSRLLQNEISARPLGLGGFDFSRRIAGKYGIFRKSGRLPSLIFLRLSGLEAKTKKSDPAHRTSINNYLKFQFAFYFEFIRQLIKTQDNYYLQKLYNFITIKNGEFLLEADKRPGEEAKTSEKTAIGVLSHIQFAPLKVDFQQRNGLTFFNNFTKYQGDRVFTHKQLSSSYPDQDDKKTIESLPSGIKGSHEEVSSEPARSVMNLGQKEGTNVFRKEITISNIDYEHVPESVLGPGDAGRIFLSAPSYLIIRPVRMVTYSANVTVSNLQRLAYAWIFGSRRYQTVYPSVSGKQPGETRSFPAKIMNFHSAGKDVVSAKPLYSQNGAAADISYENNPQESGAGENFLFNGSRLMTRPANMTLIFSNIYSNPGIAGYSKRPRDIETGSQHHAPVSGLRNPVKERDFSEPALSRTGGHQAVTNALKRSMTETGISHKTSPGSHLITRPANMTLIFSNIYSNPEIASYSKRTPDIETGSQNLPHASGLRNPVKERDFSEPALSRTGGHQAVTNALKRSMTEKGTESVLQNRTIVNKHYENIIREYEKTGYKNTIRTHREGIILKPADEQCSDLVFPGHGIGLKYGIPGGMKTPVEISTPAYNSGQELIFKKPAVQKTEIIPENREHAEKTVSRNINDTFIRESFKEKPAHEINRIADTVYRMIEKRISIEKDRRGLS